MKWRWNCQNFSLSLHLGRQFQLHGSPVSGRDSHTLHSNVHEVLGKGLEENSLSYPLNSTMCVHMKFTLVNMTKGITLQLDKEGPLSGKSLSKQMGFPIHLKVNRF